MRLAGDRDGAKPFIPDAEMNGNVRPVFTPPAGLRLLFPHGLQVLIVHDNLADFF